MDSGKLESALGRPMHTYEGTPMYATVVERSACLLDGLAKSHAFQDGNKRTAWMGMVYYLEANGFRIRDMDAETSGGKVKDLVEHRIGLEAMTMWIASRLS